jgi:hypothetical protein
MSAGGGTRTLKLFRARAPKTRAVASFATPACPAIVAPSSPTNLSAVSLRLLLFKAREAKIAIRRGLRECKAPHRCWPERLRDRAIDRHSAPNSLGLAAPATGPARDHRACQNAPLSASLACPRAPYSYLLGLYLGDGCVSRHPRAWRLRVIVDKKYPGIIDRCLWQSTVCSRAGKRLFSSSQRDASWCRTTPSTGCAFSPSAVPAGSICGGFD